MRIAIIQIGNPWQSYARDLVNGLSDAGVDVVVISSNSEDWGLIDLSTLKCDVRLVRLDAVRHLLYRRIRPKIASFCRFHLATSPQCVHKKVSDCFHQIAPVDLVIGVEKEGLELASRYAGIANIPYVYYSAELYLEDHPLYKEFGWQRKSEIANHRKASATIIQDRYRWEALRTANGIDGQAVFYLPVGISSRDGNREYAIIDTQPSSSGRKITRVLCFGNLGQHRFSGELIKYAEQLPPSICIQLHGRVHSAKFDAWLRQRRPCPTVKITTDLLPEHAIARFIQEFDIGLALYSTANINDRITAFSSQRIAAYLRESKPIITFRSESYEALFAEYGCGVMIDSLDQLQQAVERIVSNYSIYASEAKRAFSEVYNLNSYWGSLVEFLGALVAPRRVRSNRV